MKANSSGIRHHHCRASLHISVQMQLNEKDLLLIYTTDSSLSEHKHYCLPARSDVTAHGRSPPANTNELLTMCRCFIMLIYETWFSNYLWSLHGIKLHLHFICTSILVGVPWSGRSKRYLPSPQLDNNIQTIRHAPIVSISLMSISKSLYLWASWEIFQVVRSRYV